jgi:beta-alanine--pyruvate transaminase
MALAYHRARGQGQRSVFIGRERGYHGVGFGGMSVGGIGGNRKLFGSAMLPHVDHLRFIHDPVNHAYINGELPVFAEDWLLELEQRILPLHDPSNVAAIIVEPVAGSAGWYIPPQGYLHRLREMCDKHGILLIFDEVITGFGRLGKATASEFFGVTPDMITMAKAINNASIPMSAVAANTHIYDAIINASPANAIEMFHGYTYSSHPAAAAACLASLTSKTSVTWA